MKIIFCENKLSVFGIIGHINPFNDRARFYPKLINHKMRMIIPLYCLNVCKSDGQ